MTQSQIEKRNLFKQFFNHFYHVFKKDFQLKRIWCMKSMLLCITYTSGAIWAALWGLDSLKMSKKWRKRHKNEWQFFSTMCHWCLIATRWLIQMRYWLICWSTTWRRVAMYFFPYILWTPESGNSYERWKLAMTKKYWFFYFFVVF